MLITPDLVADETEPVLAHVAALEARLCDVNAAHRHRLDRLQVLAPRLRVDGIHRQVTLKTCINISD